MGASFIGAATYAVLKHFETRQAKEKSKGSLAHR
jgi:hypothetical protein